MIGYLRNYIFIYSVICGLTEETKPAHFIKAALEAVAFQTRDILEAMALDCGLKQSKLLVDGGMTANNYLMQIQADYCSIPVGENSYILEILTLLL